MGRWGQGKVKGTLVLRQLPCPSNFLSCKSSACQGSCFDILFSESQTNIQKSAWFLSVRTSECSQRERSQEPAPNPGTEHSQHPGGLFMSPTSDFRAYSTLKASFFFWYYFIAYRHWQDWEQMWGFRQLALCFSFLIWKTDLTIVTLQWGESWNMR